MADYDAVARPYALAVFELARETGTLDTWSRVLQTAAKAVESEDLIRLLNTPGIDTQAIAGVIADVCRRDVSDIGGEVTNFLRLLADNRRVLALPAISGRFEALKAEVQNIVDVILTAATPVDDAQQARIVEALKKRFGREVNLQFKLDENLIGGARLQADDLVIDGSVRTGLEKLTSALVH
ncbi:MAG: F0F1 ATP synthase subunit delta [Chlorobiales bacterium]|nr:F0F1 ATP synthase subunit delta [Chlorobiales bacterium]